MISTNLVQYTEVLPIILTLLLPRNLIVRTLDNYDFRQSSSGNGFGGSAKSCTLYTLRSSLLRGPKLKWHLSEVLGNVRELTPRGVSTRSVDTL